MIAQAILEMPLSDDAAKNGPGDPTKNDQSASDADSRTAKPKQFAVAYYVGNHSVRMSRMVVCVTTFICAGVARPLEGKALTSHVRDKLQRMGQNTQKQLTICFYIFYLVYFINFYDVLPNRSCGSITYIAEAVNSEEAHIVAMSPLLDKLYFAHD